MDTWIATEAAITRFRHVDSPVGRIRLVGHDRALTGLYLADHHRCPPPQPGWAHDDAAFDEARRQLDEYFDGTRHDFDVALELHGSAFRIRGVVRASSRSVRRDDELFRHRQRHWKTGSRSGGRGGQWPESHIDHRSVPSGHRS